MKYVKEEYLNYLHEGYTKEWIKKDIKNGFDKGLITKKEMSELNNWLKEIHKDVDY